MNRGIVRLSVSFVSVATAAWAAQPAPEASAAAVHRLQAELPGVQVAQEGARITRVFGRPLAHGTGPEDSAEQFRTRYANVLSVAPEELVAESPLPSGADSVPVMTDPATGQSKFTLVYYRQYRDGVPVFRADLRLLVRNELSYPLVLAASSLRDLGDFAVDANLRGAFDPATQAQTGMMYFSVPETVIWAGLGDAAAQPTLAATFIGENDRTDAGYEKWRYVCEVSTGKILYQEPVIVFTDVTGGVQGMATEGAKTAECNPESLFTYPWAKVGIQGGTTVYADGNGNFTIPNAGTTPVTVQSFVDGLRFTVANQAGAVETLSQSVTPGTPASFIHNQANTDELVRAQVNAYVSANGVRDWVLAQNAAFPGIISETLSPIVVNRTDGYCPGNAWSDSGDGSINFCRAGSGYPNTAWQSVVNHEYGHHVVDQTGSGQGEYGEGMADCHSMLPVDDPVLGYGFTGNCNTGLRNADNDCQYLASGCSTCGSESHDCGQLLSGCVWSTRNELIVTEPINYLSILSSLTVNSILVHSGTGITAQIPIDFLTLDDNDGNIANGTPHRTEICNGFGAHGIPCPALQVGLSVSPATSYVASGPSGGPFSPASKVYTLQNLGPAGSISYTVAKTAAWLDITNATGTLVNVGDTVQVTVSLNAAANALLDGDYTDNVPFTNTTNHTGDTTRQVTLRVGINDDCGSAKTACPGTTYTGTTAGMTNDGATSCGTANTSADAWYKYTPATSGTAVFSLCSGTSYDSVLSIHSGCPGTSANTLACDDDTCASGGASQISLAVTAGTTYRIRVSGWSGAAGPYGLTITGPECAPSQALTITFPNGLPAVLAPGTPTSFNVNIADGTESTVPSSGLLHYRYSAGAFQTAALTALGGTLYQATLPAPSCADTPQFYVSAQGNGGTTVNSPNNAPTGTYTALVGTVTTVFADDFETDKGWTVGDTGDNATTGLWTRNDPQGTAAQPEDDHTPAPGVNCWVTDYRAGTSIGDYDVDNGKTTLKSPTFSLAGLADATVSYWRWYSNNQGADPNNDTFPIDISNDGGSTWTRVETVGPTGAEAGGGWYYHEFQVASFVTPTAQMKMRFVAADLNAGSIVEAAVDDFRVAAFDCVSPGNGDFDDDGDVDARDFSAFQVCFGAAVSSGCAPGDMNGDDAINLTDYALFAGALQGPQ